MSVLLRWLKFIGGRGFYIEKGTIKMYIIYLFINIQHYQTLFKSEDITQRLETNETSNNNTM